MSTLTVTLNLVSTDATSENMLINHTDNLTIGNPLISTAKVAVLHTTVTTLIASTIADVNFVYLRNVDATNFIEIKTDAGVDFAALYPGEFAYFPLSASTGLEIQADTATCIVEYGYWTRS
jgi:hypothetical protein